MVDFDSFITLAEVDMAMVSNPNGILKYSSSS